MIKSSDIFCRVIDNFGDIGVCWRLARQLAHEYNLNVTLWVDDLNAFAKLAPALDPNASCQILENIRVRHWAENFPADIEPSDLIIEGFACHLPAVFLQKIAQHQPSPQWLNLEYLSAESWVEDCHALPSTHPGTGLGRHFWFPGFTPRTGGLIRESDLLQERNRFQQDPAVQAQFWSSLGITQPQVYQRRLSLFAYENPCLPSLLDFLAHDEPRTLLLIPEGRILATLQQWADTPIKVGTHLRTGSLDIAVLPLLTHPDYDRLLWACDINFVRGEDSFVRAQWAARPFLWHIYPQEENAHLTKLTAFAQLVEKETAIPAIWQQTLMAWNRPEAVPSWQALFNQQPLLEAAATLWCDQLAQQNDLARQLILFCQSRLNG